ncbi:hypothetical protein J8N15_14065 [Proteus mirabilis]|uniref:hypothetical protein n=1 Tax=Proteus mirabilis TaxID=584 RepID=UPI001AEE011D|nr:hypothetical protein J8N15_14065 [Proteus mirabilis]
MNKYHVIATKKDGTTYEGVMTTKEPRVTNGLIGIASLDGSWVYYHLMRLVILNMFQWLNSKY